MDLKERLLKECKSIAVVGLSPKPHRDSHEVARYLQEKGYRVIPVNPAIVEALGEKSYPDLLSVHEKIDLVDVFRRSDRVLPVVEEAVRMGARAVWMQDGIVNEEAAAVARAAGLEVVMDDCTMRVHKRLASEGRI